MGIISAGVTLDFLIGKASGRRTLTTRLWRTKPVGTSNAGPAWLMWAALQWTGDKRWQFCDDTPKTSHSGQGVRINSPSGLFSDFSHNLWCLVHIKFGDLIGTVFTVSWVALPEIPLNHIWWDFFLFLNSYFCLKLDFWLEKLPVISLLYIYSAAFLNKTWVSFLLKVTYYTHFWIFSFHTKL